VHTGNRHTPRPAGGAPRNRHTGNARSSGRKGPVRAYPRLKPLCSLRTGNRHTPRPAPRRADFSRCADFSVFLASCADFSVFLASCADSSAAAEGTRGAAFRSRRMLQDSSGRAYTVRMISQCLAVSRSVSQCLAVSRSVSQCLAVSRSVSQCLAVSRSVSQCLAVSCSVFRHCAAAAAAVYRHGD
jgi:hypothetical protein